jgi:tetratricopeptide (TPR) repeat protein
LAAIHNSLGSIFFRQGDWMSALEHYTESLECFESTSDQKASASVLCNIANIYLNIGDWSKVLNCYQKCLGIFEMQEDPHGIAQMLSRLGHLYYRMGEWELALEYFHQGLDSVSHGDDIQSLSELQNNIDVIKQSRGEIKANVDDALENLIDPDQEGDLSTRAEVLAAIGDAYAERYDWEQAISNYQKSLDAFVELHDIFGESQTIFNMALACKEMGNWMKAMELLQNSVRIFQGLNAIPYMALAELQLGHIMGLSGREKDAEEMLLNAVTKLEDIGANVDLCEAYILTARFKLHAGMPVEARFYLSRAETLITRMDYKPAKVQLCNVWGEFHQSEGNLGEAENNFQNALVLARKMNNLSEEARSLRNLGSLALAKGDLKEAESKFEDGLKIFVKLRMAYDVLSLFYEMALLNMARQDYSMAEDILTLLGQEARFWGHQDLSVMTLALLSECEIRTGRPEKAQQHYRDALQLGSSLGESFCSKAINHLLSNVNVIVEEQSAEGRDSADPQIPGSSKSKNQEIDFRGMLEALSAKGASGIRR